MVLLWGVILVADVSVQSSSTSSRPFRAKSPKVEKAQAFVEVALPFSQVMFFQNSIFLNRMYCRCVT